MEALIRNEHVEGLGTPLLNLVAVAARFERSGDQMVIQYRGGILRLIDLAHIFGRDHGQADLEDLAQVIVHSSDGRQVGFLVGEILDILETSPTVERCSDRAGILGSAIIDGNITDLIDPQSVIGVQAERLDGSRVAAGA